MMYIKSHSERCLGIPQCQYATDLLSAEPNYIIDQQGPADDMLVQNLQDSSKKTGGNLEKSGPAPECIAVPAPDLAMAPAQL
jgi:hypothetical protein